MSSFNVNGREIKIKVHQFEGTLSKDDYIKQIYSALKKIGVTQNFISIDSNETKSTITWSINNQKFSFTCNTQEEERLNLGAIAQAIQEDVRQIMRGIKDLTLVMKQYAQEQKEVKKPKGIMSFSDENEIDPLEDFKSGETIVITSKMQAKMIIDEIKSKYNNFSDYSLLPEKDRDLLRKAYLYIGVVVKF